MKKYRLRIGLDVDDILYECNAFALDCYCRAEGIQPPLTVYDIHGWGEAGSAADGRIRYFFDPDFVAAQPLFAGAQEFVRQLAAVADVFFVSAVPPACMSVRAERLAADFPEVPSEHILLGTRKDLVALDILLDDGAHNITHAAAAYPVLFRRPWNEHLSGLLAVNTYEDFLHLVDMIRHSFVESAPDLTAGGVLCLVGPTGSGKNAVAKELIKREPFRRPLSATTRQPRAGEENTYRFLDEAAFIRDAAAGRFLETTVYSGWHFGTAAADIDEVVRAGRVAVLPIDICGALTLKNRYRERALLAFLRRRRADVIYDIVTRDLAPRDKTCRILSLDDEYRNEELCDLTLTADRSAADLAADLAGMPVFPVFRENT